MFLEVGTHLVINLTSIPIVSTDPISRTPLCVIIWFDHVLIFLSYPVTSASDGSDERSRSVMEVPMRKRIAGRIRAFFDLASQRQRHVNSQEVNARELAPETGLTTMDRAIQTLAEQASTNALKRPALRSLPTYHGKAGQGNGQSQAVMAPLKSAREPCTLASLPVELVSQILSLLPSLVDLKAAVQATSIFHQAYLSDRRRILYVALQATLGDSVFVDAYAVQTTSHFQNLAQVARQTAIEHFITFIHQRFPFLPRNTILQLPACSVEDLTGISGFFFSAIRPLLQKVPEMFLQVAPPGVVVDPVSTLETRRIMRALYRFELWCNLYGAGSDACPNYPPLPRGGPIGLLENFFEVYQPWEREEIACVYTMLFEMYEGIFDDVRLRFEEDDKALEEEEASKADVHEVVRHGLGGSAAYKAFCSRPGREKPPADGHPPSVAEELRYFSDHSSRFFFPVRPTLHVTTQRITYPTPPNRDTLGVPQDHWRNGALAKGLKWHLRVMGSGDVYAKLRMILSEVAFLSDQNSLSQALSSNAQTERRKRDRTFSRYLLEPPNLLELLSLFGADAEDEPPLAWFVVFRGRYCNWCGGVLPWGLKCWGWVFWDRQRLEKMAGWMLERLAGPCSGEGPY
ncbi:uncharacterized protein B0T15DRAFT_555182 [Chaetomium strumarium]|uniref:F-box domain-containing protein n=1 Tax=Chaetomium strumarium TaxID=1170767 RepID=A0AAJ0GSA3_9PEZI|nr:hypothetical protein B0T15DRAFT_555182 [Chaetomium strumarium]